MSRFLLTPPHCWFVHYLHRSLRYVQHCPWYTFLSLLVFFPFASFFSYLFLAFFCHFYIIIFFVLGTTTTTTITSIHGRAYLSILVVRTPCIFSISTTWSNILYIIENKYNEKREKEREQKKNRREKIVRNEMSWARSNGEG